MAEHNELGKAGEDAALKYLMAKNFIIMERNWRYKQKEVDIIAMDGPILVFVEVKTRSHAMSPSDFISNSKVRYLEEAAEAYINRSNYMGDMRFDIVTLTRTAAGFHIEHIPDAFR